MRLSLRFLVPLLLVLIIIAYAVMPLVDRLTLTWFKRDMDLRSSLVTATIRDSLLPMMKTPSSRKIEELFLRVTRDERLLALGLCDAGLRTRYLTPAFPIEVNCTDAGKQAGDAGQIIELQNGVLHVSSMPLESPQGLLGYLVIIHDMTFVQRRGEDTKRYIFYFFVVLGVGISFVTVAVAHISWRGWVSGIEAILRGEGIFRRESRPTAPELRPILKELKDLVRDLETDKRAIDDSHITWTPKTLKEILNRELAGDEIIVVSNREPYLHVRKGQTIEVQYPASGLVTAIEPIMRACSGTWIAHGSGNADRDVVDSQDHVQVPPQKPSYRLRRVWLTPDQEAGYYYGFANEGLWPLCHIAHARPLFRSTDWKQYQAVNEHFARAVEQESKTPDPVILIQDYHFALLPRLVRKILPKATIITFWHIPWPNPEAFGICPWREEILSGLLGSSVMGFHTRYHCNNFLDTIDRFLECRLNRENSTVSFGGELTSVRHYPISIEWPPHWLGEVPSVESCRRAVRERHLLTLDAMIGVGVDRLDYTKGIPERLMAIDRFLELYPAYRGRFFFIQISSPSRSKIPRYQEFQNEVTSLTESINRKYGAYRPIVFLPEHHDPVRVFEYFRASDVCIVSSLHDGMNLVAKEFVAARDDEKGVLCLSQFTGASRELPEAITINPYNIDQCAEALKLAIEMPPEEQRERMRSMRAVVQQFNVFRWAGKMLGDAARIRNRNRLFERVGDYQTWRREG